MRAYKGGHRSKRPEQINSKAGIKEAIEHMNIREISINDYTYTLPAESIAHDPLPDRDASKLLVYHGGQLTEDIYRNIDQYLPAGSLLVFNNTRVVEARLLFQKPSGGTIEIFCLEPAGKYPDVTTGMQQQGEVEWKCLIGGASKWKTGQVLQKNIAVDNNNIVLEAVYHAKHEDAFIIGLKWIPAHYSFAELLHLAGLVPLPPYIKRPADSTDKERYQTVYALSDGSVAAPTAGLHFTETLLDKLRQKKIKQAFLTLHVGAGTFKPVKSAQMGAHSMHAEFMELSKDTLVQLRSKIGHIAAVGTTSARTLESIYWMGLKIAANSDITAAQLELGQWEVYDELEKQTMDPAAAIDILIQWMEKNRLTRLLTKTQLLIAPGYRFRMIRGLITNFHQPQSTLLLLVAAIAGKDWKNIYSYALDHDFRFLSYGDGCLILTD